MRYLLLALLLAGCFGGRDDTPAPTAQSDVPEWAADAIYYQIFPERFRNGDPANDPTRESLELGDLTAPVPENWRLSPWTGDWYARADWERAMGPSFYERYNPQTRRFDSYSVRHRRYGGDLQGVIDRLDYLKELGVNALYFNPLFYARSMHKYDGNTFHHIDPYFGPDPEGDFALMAQETSDPATWRWTAADSLFLVLVREAHARGLRVIIDGVFNHTGSDFFAFADLREKQEASPYKDWYIVRSFDDPATPDTNEFDYKGWWDNRTLPEFADTPDGTDLHPGPKQYIFDATARWMDPDGDGDPADGVDGWRLDVTPDVPIGFWADWNAYVRRINPQAYTVSEIWDNAAAFLEGGGFSATMNYHGFAYPVKGYLIDTAVPPSRFVEILAEREADYPPARRYASQNLIDSHDTPRLASMIVNRTSDYEQPERFDYDAGLVSASHNPRFQVRKPNAEERQIQRLVALFQMTYVGAPMIYYGTEAGMWGGDDPDDRMPMVWPDLTYDPQTNDPLGRPRTPDEVRFDSALFDFYRQVIGLRRSTAALRRGDFQVLSADDERNILAYSRTYEGQAVVVVINRSDEAHSTRIELPEALRGPYEQVLYTREGESVRVQQDQTALLLELAPRSGLVLKRGGS